MSRLHPQDPSSAVSMPEGHAYIAGGLIGLCGALLCPSALAFPAENDGGLTASDSSLWYAQLRDADTRLRQLLSTAGPPAPDLSTHNSDAARTQHELRQALADLAFQANTYEKMRSEIEAAEARVADLTIAAATAGPRTDAAAANLRASCPFASLPPLPAATNARSGSATPDAYIARMLALVRDSAPTDVDPLQEVGRLSTTLRLACSEDEELAMASAQLSQALFSEAGIRAETERLAAHRAQLSELKGQLSRLGPGLDAARQRVAYLRERVGSASEVPTSAFDRELLALAASYSQLEEALPELPGPLAPDAYCGVLVGGAIVAAHLRPDLAPAQLRDAAAAFQGACGPDIAQFLDLPLVQQAWSATLYAAATQSEVRLAIPLDRGTYWVDGVRVPGISLRELSLRPGLHRIDTLGPDGSRAHLVEVLSPGAHAVEWDGHVLALQPVDPGRHISAALESWTHRPQLLESPAVLHREAPRGRAAASLASSYLGFDGRDHWGASLELSWRVLERGAWQSHLGAAHDQLYSSEPYRYSTSYVTSALMRERLRLGFAYGTRKVRPELGLSLGLIPPSVAFVYQADLGFQWRGTDVLGAFARVGLSGQAGAAVSPLPGAMAQLGLLSHF